MRAGFRSPKLIGRDDLADGLDVPTSEQSSHLGVKGILVRDLRQPTDEEPSTLVYRGGPAARGVVTRPSVVDVGFLIHV